MRVWRVILLVALVVVSASFVPVATSQEIINGILICDGDLVVTLTVPSADEGHMYRLTWDDGPSPPPSDVKGPGVEAETMMFSWTLPGPGTWVNLRAQTDYGDPSSWTGNFNGEIETSCVPKSAGPGCTEFVDLPEQAVVGHFNWNSELYWAPGYAISPMIYVEAGNTYYVAGQDESEQFYKVLISCEWVWVRKDTVGPNYDEVWNGAPLPTTIVE